MKNEKNQKNVMYTSNTLQEIEAYERGDRSGASIRPDKKNEEEKKKNAYLDFISHKNQNPKKDF